MVHDKQKTKVVFAIDYLAKRFSGTIYEQELKLLRKKYIYKDISVEEYSRDRFYLIELKKLLNICRS